MNGAEQPEVPRGESGVEGEHLRYNWMMASLTNRLFPEKREARFEREFDELYARVVGNLEARIEYNDRVKRAQRVLSPQPRRKFTKRKSSQIPPFS